MVDEYLYADEASPLLTSSAVTATGTAGVAAARTNERCSSTSGALITGHKNPNPEDRLMPSFESPERQSTLLPAVFNLIATIVGGGVLSLPMAFHKCGILLATILTLAAAFLTNRSLRMLTFSARRTGATSYGEVVEAAFYYSAVATKTKGHNRNQRRRNSLGAFPDSSHVPAPQP